ncbi:hypothetical protein NUW58_g3062 [Xylaria curta]|uniref:Uncharacterized protein n=1 Tax=Xylaria curta TaxID=42375 RepID=A0ACC1PCN4_9PEZI|nr:hypothetical protein NUW58_g3062 [Xylaria curta]
MSSTVNLTGPALTPPDGVIPDFENHGGNHVVGYTVVILGIIISTFSVALHLANKTISKKFGLGEFLLIAAWGQYLGFQAVIYRSAVFGISRHQWNFQLKDVSWYFYRGLWPPISPLTFTDSVTERWYLQSV